MARQVDRIRRVTDRVRDLGSSVEYDLGWERRGAITFDPRGHLAHHTGTARDVRRILRDGHGRLPGPLCTWSIENSGLLVAIAAGRANHAGAGGFGGLSGNSSVLGTEITGPDFTEAQLLTLDRLHVALLEEGIPTELLGTHALWTPRKIDPAGQPYAAAGRPWPVQPLRERARRLLAPAPQPAPPADANRHLLEEPVFAIRNSHDRAVWLFEAGEREHIDRPLLDALVKSKQITEVPELAPTELYPLFVRYPERSRAA